MGRTAEIKRLQSCINDLISVLALPAIWSGSEPSQILGTLLDVLLTMLRLDFAYARLSDASDGPPIEVVRLGDHRHSSVQPQQFGQALDRCLTGDPTVSRRVVPDQAGEGEFSIASFSLGLQHEVGVLVAGTQRADFPTEVERLLLRVAANQAAIGLQEARRSGGQKQIAEMLEQRVAERTRRLTAVNVELRRSEAYLAQAQRLSRTGSFGWRVSTGEIIWSEETFRIFQYDRTTTPTVELVLQRVHPEDGALVKQTIERASQDGKNFEHEYRLLMPDGSVKYLRVVAHTLSDESGSVEFIGAVTDITERKRAEEALQQSESNLAEAQRLTHTGSWAWQVAGREALHLSEEWYRIDGFDPEEGSPGWEERLQRVHPEDRTKWQGAIDRAIVEKSEYEVEFRILLPDGTVKYIHTVGHPVLNASGDLVQFVGSSTDITERKLAEEKIRQSEMELRQILDFAPQCVAVLGPDRDRTRLYTNQTMLDYFGFTLEEWRSSDRSKYYHPDDWERLTSETQSKFLSGIQHEYEARFLRKDGKYRWFLFRWNPLRDEQGRVTRWYVAGTDIEDRKEAEQRLRDENVALREEIDRASMFEEIVGISPALHAVLSRVSKVAPTDSTVLITGETGTGKELIARAVHKRSQRS